MNRKKLIIVASITILLVIGILTYSLLMSQIQTHAAGQNLKAQLHTGKTPANRAAPPTKPTVKPTKMATSSVPGPTTAATRTVLPTPTVIPTSTTMVAPTNPTSSIPYRYFPAGTAIASMQTQARAMTKDQVKALLEKEINGSWSVIQAQLGFSSTEKAYAFFLGMATRESTLNAGLETGSGAAHSYGPIQAAETAYANANPSYTPETDVPEMTQFDFSEQNFYDPGIATYMGIRHLIHFSNQAKAAGYSGSAMLEHALLGYNTGYINPTDTSLLTSYADEIGSLAGWYLNNGHLYDAEFTWTGDTRVDRSAPWEWYL